MLKERLIKLAEALNSYQKEADEIEKEYGIVFVGRYNTDKIMVYQGIEKIEEVQGAETTLESSEFNLSRVDKCVSIDSLRFFQIGFMRSEPLFEEAKEVKKDVV